MKIYLIAAAIGSFAYYLLLCFYTRKWNSTFARFWIVCGIGHLGLSILPYGEVLAAVLKIFIVAVWLIFLLTEGKICLAMRRNQKKVYGYLIVLGAQIRGVRITNSLKRRLDTALEYLSEHPDTIVIVSGGQGKGEDIPEACAMADYLKKHGIESERIVIEDKSTSTRENLKFSARYLEDRAQPIGIVTNNFHVYRALQIGKQEGYTDLYGIAAGTNGVLFLNYMVREFFAIIAMRIRKNR